MKHPPGHPESVRDGCTCPTAGDDWESGTGFVSAEGFTVYWYAHGCPLHGEAEPTPHDTVLHKWPAEY